MSASTSSLQAVAPPVEPATTMTAPTATAIPSTSTMPAAPAITTAPNTRSHRLLSVLSEYDNVAIVMHDNPDPDAIAAGWGILTLVEETLHKPVRLIAGGAIVRAENKHMVELLQPPIELVNDIEACPRTATILVDCGLGSTNQLLTREGINPVAVIDHHQEGRRVTRLPFTDIRPKVAASATIAASYLREQRIEPGMKLATAMQYAIRTETTGCETYYSRLDRSILLWLTARADQALLAEIENAPLSREYFGDLVLALQGTFTYDDSALCLLPRAEGPEIVGEVADLLIRCQGIRRVLCGAMVNDDMLVSVRTAKDADNATQLLQSTLEGLGHGGGHSHRAGGKITAAALKPLDSIEDELRSRWLDTCSVDRQRGSRLISLREIVENL